MSWQTDFFDGTGDVLCVHRDNLIINDQFPILVADLPPVLAVSGVEFEEIHLERVSDKREWSRKLERTSDKSTHEQDRANRLVMS